MTESIKFGPEWLRNSVANVSSSSGPNSAVSNAPSCENNTMISRPVLSDHRYGREEMLSLCDKSTRLPDVLTRFRRLFVPEWQMPLALQPNTDDERSLGAATPWGPSHIRPLIPGSGLGRGGTGIIRGGSIERGRGRGRGLYHGSAGYTRSTSMYDEDGRRTNLWLDRNGASETSEWSGSGNTVSPRKEYSRGVGGMENWRKGTRDESNGTGGDVDWRSSNNGSAPSREKWGEFIKIVFAWSLRKRSTLS
jgi:PERQ amino acid-rich with GYF domain-containing protein